MTIVKLFLASLPMEVLLPKVFIMLILTYAIPPLTPARVTPAVPRTVKVKWNRGPLPTFSWSIGVDVPSFKKFAMPNDRGRRVS